MSDIVAASASQADVNSAISSASDGDRVLIPDGSVSWTTGVSTSKQIDLRAVNYGSVNIEHRAGAATLIAFTIGSSFNTKLGGINFLSGYPTADATGRYLSFGGTGKPPLVRNCTFELPNFQLTNAINWYVTGGVMWNCQVNGVGTEANIGKPTVPGSESGSIQVKSNREWETASTMGAADTNGDINLYMEDCTFTNVGQCPDVDDNGRVVIRHCTRTGSSGLNHGSTSPWGGRHVEIYDSSLLYPDTNRDVPRWFWLRAGTMLVTDCVIDHITGPSWGTRASFQFAVENATRGGKTLTSPNPPGQMASGNGSGTYDGVGGTTEVMSDSTNSLTVNDIVGKTLHNITKGWSYTIASNTATTITTSPNSISPAHSWSPGDSYIITSGQWACAITYPAYGGNQATGSGGQNSMQVGWGHDGSNHVSDPVYIWNNTGTGSTPVGNCVSYNDGSPDDCGTGKTTADFLTQDVDWFWENGAKPGWSKYTYPHPLRTADEGGGGSPSPPTRGIGRKTNIGVWVR